MDAEAETDNRIVLSPARLTRVSEQELDPAVKFRARRISLHGIQKVENNDSSSVRTSNV